MSEIEPVDAIGEGAVSGNQASIPAAIRERADIEDGDTLRWYWDGRELDVEVIRRRPGVFDGFDGYQGQAEAVDPDRVGLEPSGERDAGEPRA